MGRKKIGTSKESRQGRNILHENMRGVLIHADMVAENISPLQGYEFSCRVVLPISGPYGTIMFDDGKN